MGVSVTPATYSRTKETIHKSPAIQAANMDFASAAFAAFSDLCKIWKRLGQNLSRDVKKLTLNNETWKSIVGRRHSSGRPLRVF